MRGESLWESHQKDGPIKWNIVYTVQKYSILPPPLPDTWEEKVEENCSRKVGRKVDKVKFLKKEGWEEGEYTGAGVEEG